MAKSITITIGKTGEPIRNAFFVNLRIIQAELANLRSLSELDIYLRRGRGGWDNFIADSLLSINSFIGFKPSRIYSGTWSRNLFSLIIPDYNCFKSNYENLYNCYVRLVDSTKEGPLSATDSQLKERERTLQTIRLEVEKLITTYEETVTKYESWVVYLLTGKEL